MSEVYKIVGHGPRRQVVDGSGETVGHVEQKLDVVERYNDVLKRYVSTTVPSWQATRLDGTVVRYGNGAVKRGTLKSWKSSSAWR